MKHFTLALAMLTALAGASQERSVAQPRPGLVSSPETWSGGVSEADARRMKEAARSYSIELTFASSGGQLLLGGVQLEVTDEAGKSVYRQSDLGPIVLMNLPGGAYQLAASFGGVARRQAVWIRRGSHQQIQFRWPVAAISTEARRRANGDFSKRPEDFPR